MAVMLSMFRRQPKAELPAGQRLYAIGDVHGRLDLLDVLLDRIHDDDASRRSAETHVVLLGDLIDRGPYSAGVVRRIMAGDDRFASLRALKGNHEASLLSVLEGETRWLQSWLDYGGRASLRSWGVDDAILRSEDEAAIVDAAIAAVPPDEQAWLADLPTCHQAGDYLLVHAGVRPGVPIEAQSDQDMLWIRGEFLNDRSDHGVVVVHGHTISRTPETRHNRIGIDTGAYLSGTLTALGIDGSERWFLDTGAG
jgi:serine/threonine protein phosphatase 1